MLRNSVSSVRPTADKTAIGLSVLCVIHCLAMPLLVVLVPSLAGLQLEDEVFHLWIVIVAIPLSAFALTLGCSKHRKIGVLVTGVFGLALLCLAPLLGHELLGEFWEKAITIAGATLIALSHIKNFMLCQKGGECEYPD